ncbi:hypothetical protein ES708_14634 [subsurface metagenome]
MSYYGTTYYFFPFSYDYIGGFESFCWYINSCPGKFIFIIWRNTSVKLFNNFVRSVHVLKMLIINNLVRYIVKIFAQFQKDSINKAWKIRNNKKNWK